jgi:hypothetical protein
VIRPNLKDMSNSADNLGEVCGREFKKVRSYAMPDL